MKTRGRLRKMKEDLGLLNNSKRWFTTGLMAMISLIPNVVF